jgi:N-acetylmuramic acid 6-phosphate etherase
MVEEERVTEAGGDPDAGYESKATLDLVRLVNEFDATVPAAVAAAAPAVAAAIDAVASRMRSGGRLVYVGAGTSGHIAALDASECLATFSTAPGQVVAVVAGGPSTSPLAQAAAEDDRDAGERDLGLVEIGPADVVVGVSASGTTPYVLGAVSAAVDAGALTVAVVCAQGSPLASLVDHEIAVVVGPEFIAGSTRLKAGTAQKLVLNTLSTVVMIRLGKTYGNLMVDVVAANEKLAERVRRIVAAASGASASAVEDALAAAEGDARVAIVSLRAGVAADVARARLDAADRSIAAALEEDAP